MKTYKVTWTIELSAESPKQAAEEALDCIINGTAKVFEVQETDIPNAELLGEPTLIDLENEED